MTIKGWNDDRGARDDERMSQFGKVDIPQDEFIASLRMDGGLGREFVDCYRDDDANGEGQELVDPVFSARKRMRNGVQ